MVFSGRLLAGVSAPVPTLARVVAGTLVIWLATLVGR